MSNAPDPTRIVSATFRLSASEPSHFPPPQRSEIAFAGRSNVGKSSLMNALCQRNGLVRTSRTPGCTRQIAFFDAETADGASLTLVDLPGYGYAKRARAERATWGALCDAYLYGRPTLALVVALVDLQRGIEPDDRALIEYMLRAPRKIPLLTVGTKVDKLPKARRKPTLELLREQVRVPVSSVSIHLPESCTALWALVRRELGYGSKV